jgi:hypothetical protein
MKTADLSVSLPGGDSWRVGLEKTVAIVAQVRWEPEKSADEPPDVLTATVRVGWGPLGLFSLGRPKRFGLARLRVDDRGVVRWRGTVDIPNRPLFTTFAKVQVDPVGIMLESSIAAGALATIFAFGVLPPLVNSSLVTFRNAKQAPVVVAHKSERSLELAPGAEITVLDSPSSTVTSHSVSRFVLGPVVPASEEQRRSAPWLSIVPPVRAVECAALVWSDIEAEWILARRRPDLDKLNQAVTGSHRADAIGWAEECDARICLPQSESTCLAEAPRVLGTLVRAAGDEPMLYVAEHPWPSEKAQFLAPTRTIKFDSTISADSVGEVARFGDDSTRPLVLAYALFAGANEGIEMKVPADNDSGLLVELRDGLPTPTPAQAKLHCDASLGAIELTAIVPRERGRMTSVHLEGREGAWESLWELSSAARFPPQRAFGCRLARQNAQPSVGGVDAPPEHGTFVFRSEPRSAEGPFSVSLTARMVPDDLEMRVDQQERGHLYCRPGVPEGGLVTLHAVFLPEGGRDLVVTSDRSSSVWKGATSDPSHVAWYCSAEGEGKPRFELDGAVAQVRTKEGPKRDKWPDQVVKESQPRAGRRVLYIWPDTKHVGSCLDASERKACKKEVSPGLRQHLDPEGRYSKVVECPEALLSRC